MSKYEKAFLTYFDFPTKPLILNFHLKLFYNWIINQDMVYGKYEKFYDWRLTDGLTGLEQKHGFEEKVELIFSKQILKNSISVRKI